MSPTSAVAFHLAIPVDDLGAARRFYHDLLGCPMGRRSDAWIDFDFYGHQLVVHLSPDERRAAARSPVDGENVPVRHFGAVVDKGEWERLADQFRSGGVDFLIEPCIRHEGKPGEQGTFFVTDPAGNAIEFKWFADPDDLFAH